MIMLNSRFAAKTLLVNKRIKNITDDDFSF